MTRSRRPLESAPGLAVRRWCAGPRRIRWPAYLLLALVLPGRAVAQEAPNGPPANLGTRYSFGVEGAVSFAPEDSSYFNYTTDAYNLLRLTRFEASGALRLGSWFALVGDVRLQGAIGEGGWRVRPYAVFARFRPWPERALDIQVGLIPPVFGAFSRRAYGADNPLIGFPLGYQYVTTLRADAVPGSADELLAKRGRGWLVGYSVGNPARDYGVPLDDGLRYPAGAEVHAGGGRVEASVAVTTGSLSNPAALNVGWNPQIAGRVVVRPMAGLVLGASASHGTFLTRALTDTLGTTGDSGTNDQTAAGFDAEYSRGHLIVRTEGILSRWRLPQSAPPHLREPLRAFAIDIEGRYRLLPGLYAAIRVDRLGFSEICGAMGCLPWDAPVRRVEAGGAFAILRNIVVKGSYQYNRRDGTFRPKEGLASVQLLVWF
jgi:hypothetical protein